MFRKESIILELDDTDWLKADISLGHYVFGILANPFIGLTPVKCCFFVIIMVLNDLRLSDCPLNWFNKALSEAYNTSPHTCLTAIQLNYMWPTSELSVSLGSLCLHCLSASRLVMTGPVCLFTVCSGKCRHWLCSASLCNAHGSFPPH